MNAIDDATKKSKVADESKDDSITKSEKIDALKLSKTDREQKIRLEVGYFEFMFVVDSGSTTNLMPLHMVAIVKKILGERYGKISDRVLLDYNQHDIQNQGTLVVILIPMVRC